eukprot:7510493-Lingulodinium_polyedra.AAC.1
MRGRSASERWGRVAQMPRRLTQNSCSTRRPSKTASPSSPMIRMRESVALPKIRLLAVSTRP